MSLPPDRNAVTIASMARAIFGNSRRMADATRASSRFRDAQNIAESIFRRARASANCAVPFSRFSQIPQHGSLFDYSGRERQAQARRANSAPDCAARVIENRRWEFRCPELRSRCREAQVELAESRRLRAWDSRDLSAERRNRSRSGSIQSEVPVNPSVAEAARRKIAAG